MNIIKFDFKGHQVGFNDDGWINATEAAKKFNKVPQIQSITSKRYNLNTVKSRI